MTKAYIEHKKASYILGIIAICLLFVSGALIIGYFGAIMKDYGFATSTQINSVVKEIFFIILYVMSVFSLVLAYKKESKKLSIFAVSSFSFVSIIFLILSLVDNGFISPLKSSRSILVIIMIIALVLLPIFLGLLLYKSKKQIIYRVFFIFISALLDVLFTVFGLISILSNFYDGYGLFYLIGYGVKILFLLLSSITITIAYYHAEEYLRLIQVIRKTIPSRRVYVSAKASESSCSSVAIANKEAMRVKLIADEAIRQNTPE